LITGIRSCRVEAHWSPVWSSRDVFGGRARECARVRRCLRRACCGPRKPFLRLPAAADAPGCTGPVRAFPLAHHRQPDRSPGPARSCSGALHLDRAALARETGPAPGGSNTAASARSVVVARVRRPGCRGCSGVASRACRRGWSS
jgi:hypothetical protein